MTFTENGKPSVILQKSLMDNLIFCAVQLKKLDTSFVLAAIYICLANQWNFCTIFPATVPCLSVFLLIIVRFDNTGIKVSNVKKILKLVSKVPLKHDALQTFPSKLKSQQNDEFWIKWIYLSGGFLLHSTSSITQKLWRNLLIPSSPKSKELYKGYLN